jgi:hypothetical protein
MGVMVGVEDGINEGMGVWEGTGVCEGAGEENTVEVRTPGELRVLDGEMGVERKLHPEKSKMRNGRNGRCRILFPAGSIVMKYPISSNYYYKEISSLHSASSSLDPG